MERTRFPRRLLAVRPLACASGAFAAGTALGALCPGLPLAPLLGVLALSLVLFAILRRRGVAALCAGLFCLGAVLAVRAQQVPPLPEKRGAQIEGVVASDVDTMDGYIRMELKDVTDIAKETESDRISVLCFSIKLLFHSPYRCDGN